MKTEKNKQGDEFLEYDYEWALHKEKELENEVNQLDESLENLEDFLTKEEARNSSVKQNVLRDQKIFDLLIKIAQLIDVMTLGKFNLVNQDDPRFKRNNKLSLKDAGIYSIAQNRNNKKSPFVIASKHLKPALKRIYFILTLCIKSNPVCSLHLLDYDEFLSSQIKYYFEDVSKLLKEAFRVTTYLKAGDITGIKVLLN
jgi:hypothetical protein